MDSTTDLYFKYQSHLRVLKGIIQTQANDGLRVSIAPPGIESHGTRTGRGRAGQRINRTSGY